MLVVEFSCLYRRRVKSGSNSNLLSPLSPFSTIDRRAKPSVSERRASFLLVRVSVIGNEGCGGSDREKKVAGNFCFLFP